MDETVLKALALQWIANKVENGTAPDQGLRKQLKNLGFDYTLYLTDEDLAYIENEILTFIDDTRDKAFVNEMRDK